MTEKLQRCHVCGSEGQLSFEHIPPKSMGNNHGVRSYRGIDIIKTAGAFDASSLEGVRFSKMNRGSGTNTLCRDCNSYFGTHYVKEYASCIRELGARFLQQPPAEGSRSVHLEGGDVNLLAFFKHVISNFCATTPYGTMLDCKEFLLDRKSNDFPSRYRLYMFAVPDPDSMMVQTGWMTLFTKQGAYRLAHVALYPAGFTLLDEDESDFIPPFLGCDITDMASQGWDDRPGFILDLPLMSLDKLYPMPVKAKEENAEPRSEESSCA